MNGYLHDCQVKNKSIWNTRHYISLVKKNDKKVKGWWKWHAWGLKWQLYTETPLVKGFLGIGEL